MNLGEMTQEQFQEWLSKTAVDAVAAYVKEAGLDKIDQQHVIIPAEDAGGKEEKEQKSLTQKERFGLLAKAVWDKELGFASQLNQQIKDATPNNVTTSTDGGYLVPNETEAEIVGLIPTFGQVRSLVSVGKFPINRTTMNIPKRGTGITVYYPGEKGSITSSKLTLDLIPMIAKKAAGLAVLTDELHDFSIVDFVAYITERAAEAFGMDEDAQAFSKSGTVFTGLFNPANAFGDSNTADPSALTYDELNHMIFSLDPNYFKGASFTMHRSLVESVRNIKDQIGQPIFANANSGGLPTLLSYPVNIVEAAPSKANLAQGDPFILFGNLKNAQIRDKVGMKIDTSTEAVIDGTSLFQSDMTAIRFIRHWSFHPGFVEGLSVLKKA